MLIYVEQRVGRGSDKPQHAPFQQGRQMLMRQLEARHSRLQRRSVIAILVGRWLLAPTVLGIMLGLLLQ